MDYELIDFGSGRKLERFGELLLDRPSPAADAGTPSTPQLWRDADVRFDRASRLRGSDDAGTWQNPSGDHAEWQLVVDSLAITMQLKLTPFGHVGFFPEQQANWEWIGAQIRKALARQPQAEVRVLNLFAYTGASTLAAARAGAAVTHVDASRPVVQWARENARLSQLADAPIRWLVEDVRRFVRREIKRGNRYEMLILDPPSFGHGVKGERWSLNQHLMPLLRDCRQILSERPVGVLLTCHSPGYGPPELAAVLQESMFGRCSMDVRGTDLYLRTKDGRKLHAGVAVRYPAG